MTLESGLYCITAAGRSAPHSGLPGIRISRPPGAGSRPQSVAVSTFHSDGWVSAGDAGLVRITDGPAQVLVTVYQAPDATPDQAPRLTVLPLNGANGGAAPAAGAQAVPLPTGAAMPEVVAHVQRMGDVTGRIGEWIGTRGSRLWIEGFGLAPKGALKPGDIEYQGVLGKDWLSPWVEGGKFCGSRGMALPLLGMAVRLKGAAAGQYTLSCTASFVDGTTVGPVPAGKPCQSESLAALEAFRVVLAPKPSAAAPSPAPAKAAAKPPVTRKRPAPPKKAARRR